MSKTGNSKVRSVTAFDVVPGVGVLPIRLGMGREQVRDALRGWPADLDVESDRFPDVMLVIEYDSAGTVIEIVCAPGDGEFSLLGAPLWTRTLTSNPIGPLLLRDPSAVEEVGILYFPQLGVATTGFHDAEESQRSLALYRVGARHPEEPKKINLSSFLEKI